jgi:hypothetical protein
MGTFLGLVFVIAAIAVSFISRIWAWIILAVPTVVLVYMWIGVVVWKRQHAWKQVESLSEDGNSILQKYGYFYAMPYACQNNSAISSTLLLGGIALAIIGLFMKFWWGILFALVGYLLLGPLAGIFNPTIKFKDTRLRAAHEEIVEYLASKESKAS